MGDEANNNQGGQGAAAGGGQSGQSGGSGLGQGQQGGQQGQGGHDQGAGQGQPQRQSTTERIWGQIIKPDAGKAGSGGDAGQGQPASGAAAAAAATSGTPAATPGTPAPAGSQPINLTKELLADLGKSIAESVRGPAAAPQMSQEEFDKAFNIYRPNADLWKALRGDDEAAAVDALTQMLHGSARQATTIASHLLAHEMKQLQTLIQPAIAMAQERQMEQLKNEFFELHADLKGYEPLLVLIRDQFVAKGIQFNTKEEAFKAVAEEAQKHIEKIPGLKHGANNGQGAAGGDAGGQQNGGQPAGGRMPVLSGGKGQSGAGDGGQASGGRNQKSTAERIFG